MGTYLVPGGSGFFGQIMSRDMVGKGHTIVNIDLCDSEFKDEKFICFKGDIRDRELLEKIFSSYKFDAVFHFAAMLAHERKMMKELWSYLQVYTGLPSKELRPLWKSKTLAEYRDVVNLLLGKI